MIARKSLKILHTLAAIGYTGGIGAILVALLSAPEITTLSEHLILRGNIAMISNWIIMPSMLVVILSGLFAMVAHHPFMSAPWVWVKALTGLLVFEASLASIDAPADGAMRAIEKAQAGEIDLATLESLMRTEWNALYILLFICLVNVVLGVWRPRFGLRPG